MKTYAHDAHCNTVHVAGPEPCPPARDLDVADLLASATQAVVVHPGDTLVVRVPVDVHLDQADEIADLLRSRLPGLNVTVVAADQLLVYRRDET